MDSEPIELFADERPVDVDVDSEVIELFADERPVEVDVDSEVIELFADESPVDVEVDNDETELLVELRPVDSDEIALLDDDTVVDSESTATLVAKSCEPLIASVLVEEIAPAATFVTWRWLVELPTLTTLVGLPPANVLVTPPTVPVGVGLAAAVAEPLPSATLPTLLATAFGPIATALLAFALAALPTATPLAPPAFAALPTATLLAPAAVAATPAASELMPVAPLLL
ncbi:ATPase [Burkholderia contaminans]|nr:ATPase [Burkholderia contaminans]